MSEVIFPTEIPNGTPASDDRILLSDTSDSGASIDAPLSALPISAATQSALDAKEDSANKGVANGYAPLDASGLVPVVNLPPSAGSGDVTGPASSTDNAVARFDSTTGKLIQNSSATVSDDGSVFSGGSAEPPSRSSTNRTSRLGKTGTSNASSTLNRSNAGQNYYVASDGQFRRIAEGTAQRIDFDGDLGNEIALYTAASDVADSVITWVKKVTVPVTGDTVFSNAISASNLSGTNTGDETDETFLTRTALSQGTYGDVTGYAKDTGRTQSEFVFDNGTRTVTIQPKAPFTEFDVWIEGVKHTYSTPQSVVISNTEGNHYVYFDATGTLTSTTTFNIELIYSLGYTSSVYWDATNGEFIIRGDERHGMIMDYATHVHFHLGEGTRYYSGLALNAIDADGDGSLASHATIGVANGTIADEDIIIDITNGSPQTLAGTAVIPVLYKDGASGAWRKTTANDYPVRTGGTGRLAFNEFTGGVWTQTEVTNNNFVLAHLFATNDVLEPIMSIQGEAQYSTLVTAREGAVTELETLTLAGLPSVEWRALGTVIYQTSNSYSNAVKARIRTTDDGSDYIDWRTTAFSPAGGNSGDHGNLSGLEDDDHTQYALNCDNQTAITDYTFDGTERRNSGYLVTTASNRTVNIDADLFPTGWEVSICKGTDNANTVTLDAQVGNNINGSQTYVLDKYNEVVTLLKDGDSTWKIKSHYYPTEGLAKLSGATFTGDVSVPDEAYGSGWNGSNEVPTKNALYDKIETLGGGSSFWTVVPGSPTRTGNTTFTLTGDSTAIFAKGLALKWTESSVVKNAFVAIPSTYSAPDTTVTICGDTMSSIDSNSLKYAMTGVEPFVKRFAVAGSIGATGTNVANCHYAMEPERVLGADLFVGTAGTTNSTTVDINKAGTTMFTTKPTLATTVASSPTPFAADSGTSLALGDKVTLDIDAFQTTNAEDLYVLLYVWPTRYNNLS